MERRFGERFPHPEIVHTGNSTPRHMLEGGGFGRGLLQQPLTYRWNLSVIPGLKEWACSLPWENEA